MIEEFESQVDGHNESRIVYYYNTSMMKELEAFVKYCSPSVTAEWWVTAIVRYGIEEQEDFFERSSYDHENGKPRFSAESFKALGEMGLVMSKGAFLLDDTPIQEEDYDSDDIIRLLDL